MFESDSQVVINNLIIDEESSFAPYAHLIDDVKRTMQ